MAQDWKERLGKRIGKVEGNFAHKNITDKALIFKEIANIVVGLRAQNDQEPDHQLNQAKQDTLAALQEWRTNPAHGITDLKEVWETMWAAMNSIEDNSVELLDSIKKDFQDWIIDPDKNAEAILKYLDKHPPFDSDKKVTARDAAVAHLLNKFSRSEIKDPTLKKHLAELCETITFDPKYNAKLKEIVSKTGITFINELRQANFALQFQTYFQTALQKFNPDSEQKPTLFDIYILRGMGTISNVLGKIPEELRSTQQQKAINVTKDAWIKLGGLEALLKEEMGQLQPGDLIAGTFKREDLLRGSSLHLTQHITRGEIVSDYSHIAIFGGKQDGTPSQVHVTLQGEQLDRFNPTDLYGSTIYRLDIPKLLHNKMPAEIDKEKIQSVAQETFRQCSQELLEQLLSSDSEAARKAVINPMERRIKAGIKAIFGIKGRTPQRDLIDIINEGIEAKKGGAEMICSEFGTLFLRDALRKTNQRLKERFNTKHDVVKTLEDISPDKATPQALISHLTKIGVLNIVPVADRVIDFGNLDKQIALREELKKVSKEAKSQTDKRINELKFAKTADDFIKGFISLLEKELLSENTSPTALLTMQQILAKEMTALKGPLEKIWSETSDPIKRFQKSSNIIIRALTRFAVLLGISTPIKNKLTRLTSMVQAIASSQSSKERTPAPSQLPPDKTTIGGVAHPEGAGEPFKTAETLSAQSRQNESQTNERTTSNRSQLDPSGPKRPALIAAFKAYQSETRPGKETPRALDQLRLVLTAKPRGAQRRLQNRVLGAQHGRRVPGARQEHRLPR